MKKFAPVQWGGSVVKLISSFPKNFESLHYNRPMSIIIQPSSIFPVLEIFDHAKQNIVSFRIGFKSLDKQVKKLVIYSFIIIFKFVEQHIRWKPNISDAYISDIEISDKKENLKQ